MEPVGKILKELAGERRELGLTKPQLKRVASIELVRQQRNESRRDLLFAARPFLLCGLPLKRPSKDQLVHRRRNRRFFIQVCGHADYGLPFGQDRLIPLWVATQSVRLRSRKFTLESGHQILVELGLARNGKHYHRLMAGFRRIFTSTIFFGTDEQRTGASVWDCERVCFFDRMKLWIPRSGSTGVPCQAQHNLVVLSESFWAEISEHPIPVDREIVRGLAHSPGALDFYMWLAWRPMCADPLWLNALKPRLLQTGDLSDPASALAEIRAYGALLEAGVSITPIKAGQDPTPEFKAALGAVSALVEVHAKQFDNAASKGIGAHQQALHDELQEELQRAKATHHPNSYGVSTGELKGRPAHRQPPPKAL